MNRVMKIDTVQQYNDYFGIETSHPLVSVIEGKRRVYQNSDIPSFSYLSVEKV